MGPQPTAAPRRQRRDNVPALLLFDLLALLAWQRALGETARRLRHGRSRVRWTRFPLAIGEPARLVTELPASLPVGSAVRAELRCVREETVETLTGTRERRTQHVVHRVVWREAREVTRAPGPLALAFDLPADAPSTALLAEPPTYWELALASELPGADFSATYLVPVYAASAR